MEPTLRLLAEGKNLSRSYGQGQVQTNALRGVSLAICAGEFVGICGPSGSGKSSLLSILGLVDTPDSGELFLNGRSISYSNSDSVELLRRSYIGFVFQNFNLFPTLSAIENVLVTAMLNGMTHQSAMERAQSLLARVGLAARLSHLPSELSGGEQQRVALCRALVHEPHLILADEPTGALDTAHGDEIIDLLKELPTADRAVVMVSHSERALSRCSRTITMLDGCIVS